MQASAFLQYLVEKQTQPSEPLPTLAVISNELDVSVGKLREEVAYAKAMGIISTKPRTGMRRENFDFHTIIREGVNFGLATGAATFAQLSQLRRGVETSLWLSAVEQLDASDIAELHACIIRARDHLAAGKIPHKDHRAFHLGIFKKIDNPFAIGILKAYWEVYISSEFNLHKPFSYWEQVWDYHEQITTKLDQQAYEQAHQLLLEHFNLLNTTT